MVSQNTIESGLKKTFQTDKSLHRRDLSKVRGAVVMCLLVGEVFPPQIVLKCFFEIIYVVKFSSL